MSSKVFVVLLSSLLINSVLSDGDHAHTHEAGAAGTVTTVHTTSGDAGQGQDAFSSILASFSPDLINSLARNPQVAQALSANGINATTVAAEAAAGAAKRNRFRYQPPIYPPYSGAEAPMMMVQKGIMVVGGGILILVIIALLTKALAKGGMLYNMGSYMTEAVSGSASMNLGPISNSVAGAGAMSVGTGRGTYSGGPNNMQLNQNVQNSLDHNF